MRLYRGRNQRTHTSKRWYIYGALFLIVVAVVILSVTLLRPTQSNAPQPTPPQEKPVESAPQFEKINLQPTVDAWVAQQSGDYGIIVYDVANKAVIAEHRPDTPYFAASIYKLYVAYLALIDFQDGVQDPDEILLAGQTKKECVHKMIHSSDSPCAETLLSEMGHAAVSERLKTEFELEQTSFPAFTTSARDAERILVRLQAKKDLSAENTEFLLEAMRTQIYRNGLPAGMPNAKVANKIGFNSPENWHDTAIITLPNDRVYIVSILGGGGVSSANIADFGRTIEQVLNK